MHSVDPVEREVLPASTDWLISKGECAPNESSNLEKATLQSISFLLCSTATRFSAG